MSNNGEYGVTVGFGGKLRASPTSIGQGSTIAGVDFSNNGTANIHLAIAKGFLLSNGFNDLSAPSTDWAIDGTIQAIPYPYIVYAHHNKWLYPNYPLQGVNGNYRLSIAGTTIKVAIVDNYPVSTYETCEEYTGGGGGSGMMGLLGDCPSCRTISTESFDEEPLNDAIYSGISNATQNGGNDDEGAISLFEYSVA